MGGGLLHPVRPHRRAFSLVETALATAIVGGLMLAVIDGVGASVKAGRTAADRQRAAMLAGALLDEVCRLPYEEPNTATPSAFGLDDGEVINKRNQLDDVDDFDGVDGVPTDPDGNPLSGAESWTWHCEVVCVDSDGKSGNDTGLKRVTVEVSSGDKVLARLVRLRARARDDASRTTVQSISAPAYADKQSVTGVK